MPNVSDHILERLRAWGVDHVFGYPGDGINGLMGAFGRADNRPRFIQARHEARGVRFLLAATVEAFAGDEGRVRGVRLSGGTLVPCTCVLVGVGAAPEDELARAAGLACDGGIVTDREVVTFGLERADRRRVGPGRRIKEQRQHRCRLRVCSRSTAGYFAAPPSAFWHLFLARMRCGVESCLKKQLRNGSIRRRTEGGVRGGATRLSIARRSRFPASAPSVTPH